jgi:putative peptide zinc metalloprotease protein
MARPNLLLALRFRIRLLPERVVNGITKVLHPLFSPVGILAMLGSLVALDVWLFFMHGIGSGIRQLLYDPSLMLMVLGLLLVSAIFHECGHATACSYGGARPGAIGVGLYLVWPAFFAEVTDSFRLGRLVHAVSAPGRLLRAQRSGWSAGPLRSDQADPAELAAMAEGR